MVPTGSTHDETVRTPMPPKVKTALIWVVVIFLIYAIISNPTGSADVVRAIWEVIVGAFAGFGQFFASLIRI
nr:hypothetical protein [Antribacter soli]